jgi:hypothetical protein
MPSPLTEWRVFGHRPIETIEDDVWRVDAELPGTPMRRTMTLARARDGRVIVHSAVCLDEASMKRIEAWGAPSFLVVPNAMHRLDAKAWKTRYPGLEVVCPAGAKRKVEEVVSVDATELDLGDPDVRWSPFPGTAERESLLEIRKGARTTLVITDVVMNVRALPGFGGFVMKLMGFVGPTPKVVRAAKKALVVDRDEVRAHLEALASRDGLARVIFGHGDPLDVAPADGLRQAIATL